MLEQLQTDYAAIQSRANSLGDRVSALESGAEHSHFNVMRNRPDCIASWTLRRPEDYLTGRGPTYDLATGGNPRWRYDPQLDAGVLTVNPFTNEVQSDGGVMLGWTERNWSIGDNLVIQHEAMISQALHDLIPKPGINGASAEMLKFTNLCRPNGEITFELRTNFKADPIDTLVDMRGYGIGLNGNNLEGRLDRSEFCSDIANPTRTYVGSGGGYDRHSGPDSRYPYRTPKRPPDPPHPICFRWRSHRWIRVTYEIERVIEGCRIRMWWADDTTGPALITCSVTDVSKGFLNSVAEPIRFLYIELDSSQETTYATPQPDRWAAFRNLVVLQNVSGESVLGGRT